MKRTSMPAEDAEIVNRRSTEREDARVRRQEAQRQASGRPDVSPARLGAELAADDGRGEETETVDSLKRAAENDRRV